MKECKKLRVGLYAHQGHQITSKLYENPEAEIAALCLYEDDYVTLIREKCQNEIKIYECLEDMLMDDSIDLISLCSPMRCDQGKDAVKCLKAGKHVYAEKPASFSEEELDEILRVAKENNVEFHEMADSVFAEPYWSVRKAVRNGKVGEVIQVFVQKSYPLGLDFRPQNEEKDGGLVRQAGIHGIRFLEHITGLKVKEVEVRQTHLGNINPNEGMFTASSWMMTLSNGGVASACVNYLNPRTFTSWGNEVVRIYGTEGFIEITDGGKNTHIYTHLADEGSVDTQNSDCEDYFQLLVKHFLYGTPLPMNTEEELHPLRIVIRAFNNAKTTASI